MVLHIEVSSERFCVTLSMEAKAMHMRMNKTTGVEAAYPLLRYLQLMPWPRVARWQPTRGRKCS